MNILLWDIETSPNLGHVWDLWNQNISLDQLMESGDLLCFAYRWLGGKTHFVSEWDDGYEQMVQTAWDLQEQADVSVGWNQKKFDQPWIYRLFLEQELAPPSPVKQVDLCEVVKKTFRFPSNKLAYVSERLLGTTKIKHEGHDLWVKVMEGDPEARKLFKKYNMRDVDLLEPLYYRMLPWINSHPSWGAFTGEDVCPNCGSSQLVREGYAYTAMGQFQRYHCGECGRWSRGNQKIAGTRVANIAASG